MRDLPVSQEEVTLTFERIEQISDDKLPPSAHQYLAWWENEVEGSHIQARAWMHAGWKVDTLNLSEKWVRFASDHSSRIDQ